MAKKLIPDPINPSPAEHLNPANMLAGYELKVFDKSGACVESIEITAPEFAEIKDCLAGMRDPAFAHAVAEVVQQCARRKDDIGFVCRELLRAHAAGDNKRVAELVPPVSSILEMIMNAPIIKRTSKHVYRELNAEQKKEIAIIADKLRGSPRRKLPGRHKRIGSKRSA